MMNLLLIAIFTIIGTCLKLGDADDQCQSQYLIEAVKQKNIEILRWLINQRANVNVQDNEGMTPLMWASLILDGTHMIQELLTEGADPEIKEVDGKTALHFAAEIGGEDAVKILFGRMNNTNITDNKGRSALHYAVMSHVDDTNVLSYLIDHGMDCYKRDEFGLSSIHTAALLEKTSALKIFANKKKDLNIETADGSTSLILSSLLEKTEAAEFLVEFGVNLDTKDNKGWTALHAAAFSGNLELVKLIAGKSTALNETNSDGRTPLDLAVDQGHFAVSEYLVGKGSTTLTTDKYGNTLLHLAAKSGNIKLLELFLTKNIKLEETNLNGSTPLVVAIAEGHEDTAKLLIKAGADTRVIKKLGLPFLQQMVLTNNTNTLKCIEFIDEDFVHNTSDSREATLLHHASKNTSVEMVKYILQLMVTDFIKSSEFLFQKRNINRLCLQCYVSVTNTRDIDGRTPLRYAVEGGNAEVVEVLLDNGANQSIADNRGVNPFHVAASLGLTDILITLNLYKNNINTVDDDGKSALFYSAESGKINSLKYLINFGADTKIKDLRGRSLLHVASASGNLSVVQEIIKHDQLKSADINIKDNEGKTPAWYAINNGNFDILPELEGLGALIDEADICPYLERGNLEFFRYYLMNEPKFKDNKCFGSKTLLHIAASKGFVNIIKELKHLNKFLSMISKVDDEGKTPLWYAINNGNSNIITELEGLGAQINKVDICPYIERGNLEFFRYYLMNENKFEGNECFSSKTLLHIAASKGFINVIKELKHLNQFLSMINKVDDEGKTPLWYAINNGNLDIITELEGLGAQINKVDICPYLEIGNLDFFRYYIINENKFVGKECFGSKSLLHIAASKGFVNIFKELTHLKQFLSMINKVDDEGKTPLWYAINGEHWDCVTELEKAGGEIIPEVTIKSATHQNMISFVKYFVKKGVDIGPESENGWPIISDAAYFGHIGIIDFLLKSGANINQLVPSSKLSALHMAAMQGRCSTIEFLLDNGASSYITDKNGKTAMTYASDRDWCIDVFQKHRSKQLA